MVNNSNKWEVQIFLSLNFKVFFMETELKLKKVVLFKIGIGSFQKVGSIDLSKLKSVKVTFKKSVMNDMLKTFSILRLSGDLMVSGVSYEAKNTNRNKLLEDSTINLPENNSFSALIKQLRGIKVKLDQNGKIIEGKILGTQIVKNAPTGQAIINNELVLISKGNGKIQPVDISKISGLEISDSNVEKDFEYFLETVVGQNSEKNKVVTLFFEGKEESEYIINFLQEIPAWKTSYRLFIDKIVEEVAITEEIKSKKKVELDDSIFSTNAQLQGWAIIDNVLDEDWENVDLTLVTGLPVSFIYDSYSPAWISRPTIERKTDFGVKVVQFERELEEESRKKSFSRARMKKQRSPPRPPSGPASGPPPAPLSMRGSMQSELGTLFNAMPADLYEEIDDEMEKGEAEMAFESGAEAEGGKGVAFKYHIGTPVYVKRNNSSLIPILQGNTDGIIISVYNKNVNPKNPMITYQFINSTELTLEEGPLSVFIDKIFAGEAMLPFLESGEKCRIPYAVDQAVEINILKSNNRENYHSLKILDYVKQLYFVTFVSEYKIKNMGEKPRKIIIEHPKINGQKLYETVEPDETTQNYDRFVVFIESKETKTLRIMERRIDEKITYIHQLSKPFISDWFKLKLINKKEKDYLLSLFKLNMEKTDTQDNISRLEDKKHQIFDEQARLRQNLKALKTSKSEKNLREKYIMKFDQRESELEDGFIQMEKLQATIKKIDQKILILNQEWVNSKLDKKEKSKNIKKGD